MAKNPDEDRKPDEKDLLTKKVDEMMDLKGPAAIAEAEDKAEPKDKKKEKKPKDEKETVKSDVAEVAASVNQELSASLGQPLSLNEPTVPAAKPASAPKLPGAKPEPETVPEPAKKLANPIDQVEPADPEPSVPEAPAGAEEFKVNEYDDSETNEAVDDIANEESDLVLAVEDLQRERQNPPEPEPKSRGWFWVCVVIVIILAAAGFLAYSGYGLKSLGL